MEKQLFEKPPTKRELVRLANQGILSPKGLERSLTLAKIHPDQKAWQQFADRMLLILGAVLTVSGIFFFFAYNWQDMGHFLKLGLIEAIFLGLILFVTFKGFDKLSGKITLTVACFIVGVLFAVYGQVYQTGADSYQFFFTWGMLILGFALISQFTAIWFHFYVLMNLSLFFYNDQIMNIEYQMVPFLFIGLNGAALIIWEIAHQINSGWMKSRWMGRVISLPLFVALLIPTWQSIFGYHYNLSETQVSLINFSPFLFFAAIAIAFYLYSKIVHDLFILAVGSFSLISVIMVFLGDKIDLWDAWFFMGLVLIGLTGLAVQLLRQTSASWEVQHELQ